jgi:hypothetical protein
MPMLSITMAKSFSTFMVLLFTVAMLLIAVPPASFTVPMLLITVPPSSFTVAMLSFTVAVLIMKMTGLQVTFPIQLNDFQSFYLNNFYKPLKKETRWLNPLQGYLFPGIPRI